MLVWRPISLIEAASSSAPAATACTFSLASIEALAAIRGCDPADLEPLYRAVDPEALDRICAAPGLGRHSGDTRIEFTYLEHEVVVKSLGLIEIRPLEDE